MYLGTTSKPIANTSQRFKLRTVYQSEIHVLDLSDLPLAAFPYDRHPNPADHRRIAEAIANSFASDLLEEIGGE